MERVVYRSQLPLLIAEKSARDGVAYTPTDIARATKLSRQTIYDWLDTENDRERISLVVVERLRGWLGCEWHDLIIRKVATD